LRGRLAVAITRLYFVTKFVWEKNCEHYRVFAFPSVETGRAFINVDEVGGTRQFVGEDSGVDFIEVVGDEGRKIIFNIVGVCSAVKDSIGSVTLRCAKKRCEKGGRKCPRKPDLAPSVYPG